MQYSTVLLAAFAAAVSAAPTQLPKDTLILITLSGADELATTVKFQGNPDSRQEAAPPIAGPFNQVSIDLGNDFVNKEIRCQLVSDKHDTIVATHGANIDINFSDGGAAAPWTFLAPANVSKVICDPILKKITPEEVAAQDKTFVTLDAEGVQPLTIGPFTTFGNNAVKELKTHSNSEFTTVNVKVGKFTNPQALRCQLKDNSGRPITAKRGQNIDTTFSDAGKGKWNFLTPQKSVVQTIVCDPKFAAAPQN